MELLENHIFAILHLAALLDLVFCVFSLWETITKGVQKKIDTIDYTGLLLNYICMCSWLTYSIIENDVDMIFSNLLSAFICLVCLGMYFSYINKGSVIFECLSSTIIIIFFSIQYFPAIVLGCFCAGLTSINYFTSLDEISEIWKAFNEKFINFPLICFSFLNALTWGLFGLADSDYFILIPSIFGVLINGVKIWLYFYLKFAKLKIL